MNIPVNKKRVPIIFLAGLIAVSVEKQTQLNRCLFISRLFQ
jgi:hypothetical protein